MVWTRSLHVGGAAWFGHVHCMWCSMVWTCSLHVGGAAWFGHVHCVWCSMVWTCSLHVGDIRREMLKMLLVYTRGEDETWISQKTE